MNVLVLNVGSTSVKYDLFEMDTEGTLASGTIEPALKGLAEDCADLLSGPFPPDGRPDTPEKKLFFVERNCGHMRVASTPPWISAAM